MQFSGVLQGIAAVVGLVSNLVLIPVFGIVGSGGVVGGQLLRAGNGAVGLEPVSSISGGSVPVGGRLARFAVAFVCFAAATLWERDASLPKEILYSGLLVCLLLLIAYQQLEVEERRYVWNGPLRAFRIGLPAGEPPEVANERQRLSR